MEHPDIIAGDINFTQQLKSEGFQILDLSPIQVLFTREDLNYGFLYDYSKQTFSSIQGEKLKEAIKLGGQS